jgi:hypothetical protein
MKTKKSLNPANLKVYRFCSFQKEGSITKGIYGDLSVFNKTTPGPSLGTTN